MNSIIIFDQAKLYAEEIPLVSVLLYRDVILNIGTFDISRGYPTRAYQKASSLTSLRKFVCRLRNPLFLWT